MEYLEFKKIIIEESKKINIELSDKKCLEFFKYMNLLIEWNEKVNLTAIVEPKEIIKKHFIDSITINKYINNSDRILDMGTGAGFPGIPLKIVNEINNIVLVDSLNKRINFLNEVISELKLNNINAIHSRAEELANNKNYRENFDIVTSRAVASLNVLVEYMLPFVKIGGKCICMKGSNIKEEIKIAENAINLMGGKIEKIEEFVLPNSDIKRNIIVITKQRKTPDKYPRKAGTPSKEPL